MFLSVYSTDAFETLRLPALKDANYAVELSRKRFSLRESVAIRLENIHGQWFLQPSETYSLLEKGEARTGPVEIIAQKVVTLQAGENRFTLAFSEDAALEPFAKIAIAGVDNITIGSGESCHVRYAFENYVSERHARIFLRDGLHVLEDTGSKNGVFINGLRIRGESPLRIGDIITLFDLSILYLGDILAVNTALPGVSVGGLRRMDERDLTNKAVLPDKAGRNFRFSRAPRTIMKLHDEEIELDGPPQINRPKKQPMLYTIGPAFTMMIPMLLGSSFAIFSTMNSGGKPSPFMFTGIITAVGSAIVGVLWAVLNLRRSKKSFLEEDQYRFEKYHAYLERMDETIAGQYEHNKQVLLSRYPSAEECCAFDENSTLLWNRNARHSDFLFARLGIGDVPFQVPIKAPRQKFTLVDDALAERPSVMEKSYRVLHGVPVGVDLLVHNVIGIYDQGGASAQLRVLRALAVQIAANNCYTDVKMVFLYGKGEQEVWNFAQWLPHVWSEDRKTRYIASERNEITEVLYALSTQLRRREEQASASIPKPYYVVFVSDPQILDEEPAAKYLLEQQEGNIGITTILCSDSFERLPNACRFLVEVREREAFMMDITTMDAERALFRPDVLDAESAEVFARNIAPLYVDEMETGSDIVSSLSFLDMFGVDRLDELDVLNRWRKNRTYETMAALIGQKAGGVNIYLDIHEKHHGPHGLMAGTTGSGKSETLQTYILSLALQFSPQDVAFLLIDYKGGGMANLFTDLPHLVGQISNLSGNQARRAMVSIESEIKRRQHLFQRYGVNHIDDYSKIYQENKADMLPMPHMLIIIDEFAELKEKEPEFMGKLISVAQVGRSLGIHLILATQKPSGKVDDNIWSNSKFRICLRVQERQDSIDMLKRPDAAYITEPGRGYMQVGNDEIFELFQSGWSGAAYDEEAAAYRNNAVTMLTLYGKPSIVGKRTRMQYEEQRRRRWIDALGECAAESLEACGFPLPACAADETALRQVSAHMMETALPARKLPYAASEHNRRALADFLLEMESLPGQTPDWAEGMLDKMRHGRRKFPEQEQVTQLAALIRHLRRVSDENSLSANLSLWMPLLPTELCLEALAEYPKRVFSGKKWQKHDFPWSLQAYIGLYDDPENQTQQPLVADFAVNGHTALCGSVATGKSTLMQTMLFSLTQQYSPAEAQFYILDFGSGKQAAFADAPHCGQVIPGDDLALVAKFFSMTRRLRKRRRALFGSGSYEQYIRANGLQEPALIIAIDNFAALREKTEDSFEQEIKALINEGINIGIYVLATFSTMGSLEIQGSLAEKFKTAYCLELPDKFAYMGLLRTNRLEVLPADNVKGRGLALVGERILEYQTALALPAEDDYARAEAMRREFSRMAAAWEGAVAKPVPTIPKEPKWEDLQQAEGYAEALEAHSLLPLGFDQKDANVFSLDLSHMFSCLFLAKKPYDRVNALLCAANAARDKNIDMTWLDPSGHMAHHAARLGARHVSTDEDLTAYFQELFDEVMRRQGTKKQLTKENRAEKEIYRVMRETYPPLFVFLPNLAEFMAKLNDGGVMEQNFGGFFTNFLEKGDLRNIFVFAGIETEMVRNLAGRSQYMALTRRKSGVLLSGKKLEQQIFDMDDLTFQQENYALAQGEAWVSLPYTPTELIVMPSAM